MTGKREQKSSLAGTPQMEATGPVTTGQLSAIGAEGQRRDPIRVPRQLVSQTAIRS